MTSGVKQVHNYVTYNRANLYGKNFNVFKYCWFIERNFNQKHLFLKSIFDFRHSGSIKTILSL